MEEKNYNPISQEIISEIKNYLFPIEINGKYGTVFFFQICINTIKAIYLCISYDLLSEDYIKAGKELKINENIKLKLNESIKILSFNNQCKLILIEEDKIPRKNIEKHILDIDIPSGKYTNQDAYLFAYSYPFNENGGGYIQGKIINVDGYKILEFLHKDKALKQIPVIVCTSEIESEVSCLEMGAVDFIAKPYEHHSGCK